MFYYNISVFIVKKQEVNTIEFLLLVNYLNEIKIADS